MGGQIVVVLKARDRVEDFIPYLEAIAKLGTKIVFFFSAPSDEWRWLLDHWLTTESPRQAMTRAKSILEKYSWPIQIEGALQRILPVREALEKRGVEVSVLVHTRRLRTLLRDYIANADVHLIMQTARANPFSRLLRPIATRFRSIEQATLPPVVLFHPIRKPRFERQAFRRTTRGKEPYFLAGRSERDSKSFAAGS